MLIVRMIAAAAACLTVAACGRRPVAEISRGPDVVSGRWNGSVSTPEDMRGVIQAHGGVWLAPVDGGRKSRVGVSLDNMVPGGRHPWVLRSGQCGVAGASLARIDGRNALRINNDGEARGESAIDIAFPTTGDYMVEVLASEDNQGRVIACGNLAPPTVGIGR